MTEQQPPSRSRAAELLDTAARKLEAARVEPAAPEAARRSDALTDFEDKLQEVDRLARQVTSILELRPLLARVVEAVVAITEAERGFLMLCDDRGELGFQAARARDGKELPECDFELSRGVIHEVAESSRSVFIPDTAMQSSFGARESVVALGLRSVSCVPLVHKGRVLGVCYSDSLKPIQRLPEKSRDLLESFAGHAALAITNARQHGEVLVAKSKLEAENRSLRHQIELERRFRFKSILGESPAMEEIYEFIEQVCTSDVNVMLQGETGTGKELIAQAIHEGSPRRNGRLVAINCGALSESLLEGELFGSVRGAFTGAERDRAGLFEEANGGTLFLDEVGEAPPSLQTVLLRVLQDHKVRRIGDNTERKVDFRIISATNRDLRAELGAGRFREDLFYRLNVVPMLVPPLRERGNDIVLLARDFLRRYALQHGKSIPGLAPDAEHWLLSQKWPGNIRELQNCVQYAVTLCRNGARVGAELLQGPVARRRGQDVPAGATLRARLDAVERDEVRMALERCAGSVTAAAKDLGITRQHLYNLIRKHALGPSRNPPPV